MHYIELRLGLRLQLQLGGLTTILCVEGFVLLNVYLTVMICQYQQPWRRYVRSLHFNGHFPGEPGLAGVY